VVGLVRVGKQQAVSAEAWRGSGVVGFYTDDKKEKEKEKCGIAQETLLRYASPILDINEMKLQPGY
jgi:hypothetical protein